MSVVVSINPALDHLACSLCARRWPARELRGLCACGAPLLARYRLDRPWSIDERAPGLWRYRRLLPVDGRERWLGEGGTPLVRATKLAATLGLGELWIKDESRNPTGSFKARGMAVAVAMARALGVSGLVAPSAGNAGVALAAYAARWELRCAIVMPRDTPAGVVDATRRSGAEVTLVDALIDGAGVVAGEIATRLGFFNVATFAEPYRVEGKKTMAIELVEGMDVLPDAIVYPLGGGTGIVAFEKAFDELEALGRIGSERPRLLAVQWAGCAPVVRAWERGDEVVEPWESSPASSGTRGSAFAPGLRVPSLRGGRMVLAALRRSGGGAVAVEEEAARVWSRRVAGEEGVFLGQESACAAAGLEELTRRGHLTAGERVVLFHTGAPYEASGGS